MSSEFFYQEEFLRAQGQVQYALDQVQDQQTQQATTVEGAVLDIQTTTLTTSRNANIVTLDVPTTYLQAQILSANASLNFDLTTNASQDLTITLTGAIAGEPVWLGVPNGSVTADTIFFAWVSATDTVTVRAMRIAGTPDPASGTFTVKVIH